MKIATADQMRKLDQRAFQDAKIPSALLMDRAAQAVANAALSLLGQTEGKTAALFCGTGSNGGDGIGAARHLQAAGVRVRAFLVGSLGKLKADAREMLRRLEEAGGSLEEFVPGDPETAAFCYRADVLVDAVFGIGLRMEVQKEELAAIELMNRCPAPVVSADIPSGVEADTGRILGKAARARHTVTFTLPKAGHFAGDGKLCRGTLEIADIGIPREFVEEEPCQIFAMTGREVKKALPRRRPDGHKGNFGKVLIAAGSVGFTGAPCFAARGASRTGAGLVFLYVPEPVYEIEAVKNDEAMVFPLPAASGGLSGKAAGRILRRAEQCDAVLAGPGLGQGPGTRKMAAALVKTAKVPLVLDADGLNGLGRNIDKLGKRDAPLILTPHEGEFARLGGDLSHGDRIGAAREFAKAHRCVLVLKGHATVTALPDGTVYLNTTGNSGMAKGGSGDVLSGMILALLGQKMEPGLAAAAAVWLHGRAGDLCAQDLGEYGMTPSDLLEAIPKAIFSLDQLEKTEKL
ncbi:MAG: NAD(P)H-hydrate dehydratase [Oscillospiraceae bacterium]|nr:NAD(P)H-hydrate dehydratase [Oscillospiraceae bacterium]